ncbi:MAG: DUF6494 family protein [Albidovulum sp.]
MNDEFNMSLRKFLKQVGVTSQQAIEAAMRDADTGTGKTFKARMELKIEELNMTHVVEGEIMGPSA